MALMDQLNKWIAPLRNRVLLMVSKAIITNVDDTGQIQMVQVELLSDEVKDKVQRIQQYGFTSNPKKNSEAVVLFVGGNRDHGIVIATDGAEFRISNLNDGEVALYNDQGAYVKLLDDGNVEVNTDLTVKGDLQVDGKIKANGTIEAVGAIKAGGVIWSGIDVQTPTVSLLLHTHIGVTTGVGVSGVPSPGAFPPPF